uniref:Uncharacterized protein n=1 Tax=Arundo donax TaxID=35708 RepID=A0A0A8Y5I2_ARUDO
MKVLLTCQVSLSLSLSPKRGQKRCHSLKKKSRVQEPVS